MGLWDAIKRAFGIRPKPARDVSGDPDADLDDVREIVDTTGGPLRPEHRRLALRDPRLLPKRKRKRKRGAPVGPSKRTAGLMSASEASRLFAGTLRTRDRSVRELLCDEAQLDRLGLPSWKTEADVALPSGSPSARCARTRSIESASEHPTT